MLNQSEKCADTHGPKVAQPDKLQMLAQSGTQKLPESNGVKTMRRTCICSICHKFGHWAAECCSANKGQAMGDRSPSQTDQTEMKALNAKAQTGSEVHQTKEEKSGETKSEVRKSDNKKSGQRKSDSMKPGVVMPNSQQWPNSSGYMMQSCTPSPPSLPQADDS